MLEQRASGLPYGLLNAPFERAGEFVTLRDVVGEVGPDVVRFIMLYRKNDAPLDFDFEKVTEQSRDNPVFYVQYAHARICSVFRNAELELGESITSDSLASADLSLLIAHLTATRAGALDAHATAKARTTQ